MPTDRRYLFVIDGAKALRAAIDEVFGADQAVQRCRNHKVRNVLDELPREQQAQVRNLMRAAWKLTDADEGMKRLEQLARFLEAGYESAAGSLREGMSEMFTIQRLESSPFAVQMFGYDEHHREPAERSAEKNQQRHPLAHRRNGSALGGLSLAADRKALPESIGLQRFLGLSCRPGKREKYQRHSRKSGVTWTYSPHSTFN